MGILVLVRPWKVAEDEAETVTQATLDFFYLGVRESAKWAFEVAVLDQRVRRFPRSANMIPSTHRQRESGAGVNRHGMWSFRERSFYLCVDEEELTTLIKQLTLLATEFTGIACARSHPVSCQCARARAYGS